MADGEADGGVIELLRCERCPDVPTFFTAVAHALHMERHRADESATALPVVASELEEGELRKDQADPRQVEGGRPQFSKRFECPECPKLFGSPETFSVHVERHREVMAPILKKDGSIKSVECPKKCSRHFLKASNAEYRAHVPMCNGSPPLGPRVGPQEEKPGSRSRGGQTVPADARYEPPVQEPLIQAQPLNLVQERKGTMAMKCNICGQSCENGTGLSAHKRGKHKESPGRTGPAETPQGGSPGGNSAVQAAIEKLRQDRADLISSNRKVELLRDRIEMMQKQLDSILGDIPGVQQIDGAIAALVALLPKGPT